MTFWDFFEFSSWAAFDVALSVTIEKETAATSGLADTFPSPLKETVLVVAAVFAIWFVLTNKNTASITKTTAPDQMSGL